MDDKFRLAYSQRDYATLDAEVERYIKAHFPNVSVLREGTPGRAYLRLFQGLVDLYGMAVDIAAVESRLGSAQQAQNAAAAAEALAYFAEGPTPARTDLIATMITGVAPAGGQVVPRGARFSRVSSPTKDFVALEEHLIPEGHSAVSVGVAEGTLVTEEVLTASYIGVSPTPLFKLSSKRVWRGSVRVYVANEEWTYLPMSELSRGPNYPSFRILQDPLTLETYIWFPSLGPWAGRALTSGVRITSDYLRHSGAAGDTAAGLITKVQGGLSSLVSVTNPEAATGGSDGEDADTIRSKAPRYYTGANVAVSKEQIQGVLASVPGVKSAVVTATSGLSLEAAIMPLGGGTAAQSLLDTAALAVMERTILGASVEAKALFPAYMLSSMDVFLKDGRLKHETARSLIKSAISASLNPDLQVPGRGITYSDLNALVLGASSHVDYVDLTKLTRVPRVVPSVVGLPACSEVTVNAAADNAVYVITALSSTTFQVAKDGVIDPQTGVVNTTFTTAGGEVTFIVGSVGEEFPAPYGQTYRFSTSRFLGNLRIDSDEFVQLRQSSDLVVRIYYPGENA